MSRQRRNPLLCCFRTSLTPLSVVPRLWMPGNETAMDVKLAAGIAGAVRAGEVAGFCPDNSISRRERKSASTPVRPSPRDTPSRSPLGRRWFRPCPTSGVVGRAPVTPCRSRVHEVERNGPPSGLMSNSGSALKWVGLAPSVLLGDSPQPASNAASTAVKASAIRVMSLDRKIGSWSEADQLPCDVGHMTPPRSLPICSAEVTCPLSTLCAEAERCRGGSSRSLRPD